MLESFEEGAEQFVENTKEPQDINVNSIVKADDECCSKMQKGNIIILLLNTYFEMQIE